MSTASCVIGFSNGRLEIEARNIEIDLRVEASRGSPAPSTRAPVKLVWNPELAGVFDPRSLPVWISGAELTRLHVNEMGLLLYTRGNPILWFHAVCIRDSGDDFLFAHLEEWPTATW